jgi:hypothetical protein
VSPTIFDLLQCFGCSEDHDPGQWYQDQQVLIAADEPVDPRGQGEVDELVVVWVPAVGWQWC